MIHGKLHPDGQRRILPLDPLPVRTITAEPQPDELIRILNHTTASRSSTIDRALEATTSHHRTLDVEAQTFRHLRPGTPEPT
jgi:hypothetical protein